MPKNPRLKVGLVFDDTLDSNDGVAQYVKTLGAWLSANGHSVTYLVGQSQTTQWAGGEVISLSKNIGVKFNGNRLSMPAYSSKRKIKKVLDQQQFDVLHVQMPYSPIMAGKVIKLAPPATAVVGTFHIFPSGRLSSFGSRLLKLYTHSSLKRFVSVLSVSTAAQEFAAAAYKLKSQVVPNTIEVSKFKNSTTNKPNTIIFLGRLVPRKGCQELIEAFILLKQQVPDAKLIIGGKGPQLQRLQNLVAKNNLNDVSFLGFVAEDAKPAFLAQAAVACFPSLGGESFGIVLLEAMAAGAGVVLGGNNPGYSSVLAEQPNLLIDPKNTKAFAGRLQQLLSDAKLRNGLHDWQEQTIKQYDVSVVGAKIVNAYRAAIALKTQSGHN